MPESDYEYWTPKNFNGDKCLFGKKLKYLRRKREAQCFNPEDVERECKFIYIYIYKFFK